MKFTLTIFLITVLSISCNAQCNAQLEKYVSGFEEIKANSFSFLDNELNDVRVFGYGEDTHGTSEFTKLTEELMKYLSEKHGFKILVIETGFGEGVYLNDYIQGKRNDLKNILNVYNSTWRYRTKEFHQLMNWLKGYNQNNSEKIHIYGCEMQYVIADVNQIRDYLTKINSNYKIEGFEKHLWQNIEDSEKSDYYISYLKIKKYFKDNHESFKRKTSEKEFNLVYHHIEVLGQFVTAISQNVKQRQYDFRDIYMGENIQWILNFHGDKSKALYWAHNAHVGDWVNNGIVDVTGHQLRKILGKSYFNIATDFGEGEFIAFPYNANETNDWRLQTFKRSKVLENTFTNCLKQMGNSNTFLNVRKAKTNQALKTYLEGALTTMSGAGAKARKNSTETNDIGKAFDGIIYLNQTTKINLRE
ncbi:MAG: erythromycin esterase family protein [Flavobacteriaceae bacterium]|nr:erythromycin esterase family protein [Flavobacteriaceae bacterium]